MNKTKIFISVTVISLGFFGFTFSAGATTYISSLPFNANQAGETYVLASDLSLNSGNAITISANNIVIDGNGHEIRYAEAGSGYGININTTFT